MSDIKPKLLLRTGVNAAEKSPSPSAKLMLNHGKPNFTINRSKPKTDAPCPFSPSNPEAASVVLKKSVPTNVYVKPSDLKIPLSAENEVVKVVLRRTKLPEENGKPQQQDEEPEFIKAQRKIAERLANQNNLDFESRKSGYFTHVMMSPTTPTKSFEMPVVSEHKIEKAIVVEVVSESTEPLVEPTPVRKEENVEAKAAEPAQNGHDNGSVQEEKVNETEAAEVAKALVDELVKNASEEVPLHVEQAHKNGHENGHENGVQNGHSNGLTNDEQNDSSHSQENGHHESVSQSDVNFELKTVTSFSKDLSSEPNKYPDTVKVVKEAEPSANEDFIEDMYKLKFDIHADSEDVKVTPTVRASE